MIEFTILYDNNPDDERLTTRWGFACLIEQPERTVLFDTGGDGPTLLKNMEILGKDPTEIDLIILSHEHGDHTGGLGKLLEMELEAGLQPEIYVPAVFQSSFKDRLAAATPLVEVSDPQEIRPGLWSTGQVEGSVTEQAAAFQTAEGWVLVTGCAHPGVEAMTEQALEVTGGPISLVMGGYHLRAAGAKRIAETIETLKAMDVAAVAPTHCTGDRARAHFAEAFGDRYYGVGVGSTFRFRLTP